MYEYKTRIHRMVEQFPPPGKHGDWQLLLHKMVSSYLVSTHDASLKISNSLSFYNQHQHLISIGSITMVCIFLDSPRIFIYR